MDILNSIDIQNHNLLVDLNNYNDEFKNNIEYNYIDINKNLNLISEAEKDILIKKYLTENAKNNIILTYELLNYNPIPKKYSIIEFKNIIQYLFDRYTYKVGGNYFDTNKWIERKNDWVGKNNINMFIFQNTIHDDYINDIKTKIYLLNMYNLFKKISINYDIQIKTKYNNRDNIHYIFFIFIDNNEL
jgi:hypothetical protein